MRKWSPSKKTVGIWAGAVLLAAMSLPSPPLLPQSGERHRHHSAPAQTMPRVGAIPTMASFDEDGSASGKPAAASTAGTTASTTASTTTGTTVSTTASTTAGMTAGTTASTTAGMTVCTAASTTAGMTVSTAASTTAGMTATNQNSDGANDKHSPNRPKPAAPPQQQPGQWQKRDQAQQPGQAQQPRQQQPGQAQRPAQQPGHTQQQQQQRPSEGQQPRQQQPAPAPVAPQQLPDVGTPGSNSPFTPYVPWPTGRLRLRVIDGRTLQPLEGAEVVLIETEQRMITDRNGYTPWVDAPMIRNPRYRPMVAELHGQLGVIAYKNGYRDSIHLGIRMHEGFRSESTVWMYKLGPGDTRVEPVLYQVPYHHLWLVELADKFRSKSQPGEGPERP